MGRSSRSGCDRRGQVKRILRGLSFIALAAGFWAFLCALPDPLFRREHSTVLYSAEGQLLNAITARDGQWRFPERQAIPDKFRHALTLFEDRHFPDHSGIYLPSLMRAVVENIRQGKVVRGGSTLSMQVIRMSRNNPPRTIREKLVEMALALRLEWRFSKDEILALYASHAPFGGNVVGLDAASWRYFGHPADELSWAESATLAVLPNAPSLIFPGKNSEKLLIRRNTLLQRLHKAGYLDRETLELSYLEPLPGKPYPLAQRAPHLMTSLCRTHGHGKIYRTTIRSELQQSVMQAVNHHVQQMEGSYVQHTAALVVEVATGHVLAYVGNRMDGSNSQGSMVDVIPAPRSSGSILKPFLYAAMMQDGQITPHALVADIPIQFDGFSPRNYNLTFDGAVPASRALSRSLNVPSVIMLRDYGYARFHHKLRSLGFTQLQKPADHYGLSLILGGAEACLWDIARAYAGMARTLNRYNRGGGYREGEYTVQSALLAEDEAPIEHVSTSYPPLSAASIYTTFQSLLEVNRPETELGWETYTSSGPVAWKTGTSFGNRDAWAVGTTPEYVVAVWVGNADGTGRPELTGVHAAAPLLFDLFSRLPSHSWFAPPLPEMERVVVCRESGMLALPVCIEKDTTWVPAPCASTLPCFFHRMIHLNQERTHQVTSECHPMDEMVHEPWFILPGVQEYYYVRNHPSYRIQPPFLEGCQPADQNPIAWIYPKSDSPLVIPRNLTRAQERAVLKASHRRRNAVLYWHLDGTYIGRTEGLHEVEIMPRPGIYRLTLVDDQGSFSERRIEILDSQARPG